MTDARFAQTRQTTSEHAVLGDRHDLRIDRVLASSDLAPLAERHRLVAWDLPPGRPRPVTLLTHPCVNLVSDLVAAAERSLRAHWPTAGPGAHS